MRGFLAKGGLEQSTLAQPSDSKGSHLPRLHSSSSMPSAVKECLAQQGRPALAGMTACIATASQTHGAESPGPFGGGIMGETAAMAEHLPLPGRMGACRVRQSEQCETSALDSVGKGLGVRYKCRAAEAVAGVTRQSKATTIYYCY